MSEQIETPKSLSQVKLKDFINCRIRLQRIHDASSITGWIEFVSEQTVEVRISFSNKVEANESFYAEMHGPQCVLGFQCILTQISGVEIAEMRAKVVGDKEIVESEIQIELSPIGQPKILPLTGEARRSVAHLAARATHMGIEMECRITDLSSSGVGFLLGDAIPRGDEVQLHVSAGGYEADIVGQVRYSRKVREGVYRVGVQLSAMDRIKRNQWRQVCEALTLVN